MLTCLSDKLSGLINFKSYKPLIVKPDYFSDAEISSFKRGEYFSLYKKLGSHPMVFDGREGIYFAVWAPHAKRVTVMGSFNEWNKKNCTLGLRDDCSGIWEGFVADAKKGDMYKFCIYPSIFRKPYEKADPYALAGEYPPKSASVVWDLDYRWKDEQWLKNRPVKNDINQPISVYEVHLGSWRKNAEEKSPSCEGFKTYRQLSVELVDYVKDMGFTHVEFLPIMEHPFYASWGYQALGFFYPTKRYGDPEELMCLIDCFHQAGIGVILDWVPSHFPSDSYGLVNYDGKNLYELDEYHPDWNSAVFNNGSAQVQNFLISNALFWIEKYHLDGLRVDAVASMLYLDYSRKKGEWQPNFFGGNENLDSVAFIRRLNEEIKARHPDVLMIAEESTSWPKISRPVDQGGLGFDMKWNMGWMHDTLKYFKKEPEQRTKAQNDLTFSLFYAFNENFILSLSHDEVVHEKSSLLGKMPGEDVQKFANLRCLYGFMYAHPGKKLLFMGAEFAQWKEWAHDDELEWDILEYAPHRKMLRWVKDLNQIYAQEKALYELDFSFDGFEWIDLGDKNNCVIAFLRKSKEAKEQIFVACNFGMTDRLGYTFNVRQPGQWQNIMDSHAGEYCVNGKKEIYEFVQSIPERGDDSSGRFVVDLPALSIKYFKKCENVHA